jgi:glycosyltransferase involved in cell wall biosynthesis
VFATLRRTNPELKLVLVGHLEEPAKAVLREHPELSEAVIHCQAVNLDDLRALYSVASALLFPSWMEGFGWPVLEALACGCAVITTDRDPMQEVGGGAAVYVASCPSEKTARKRWVASTAATAQEVLDRSGPERLLWRARGIAQAARFNRDSWLDQLEQALF